MIARPTLLALALMATLTGCDAIVGIHDLTADTCDLTVHVDTTTCSPCAVGVQWTVKDSNGQSFTSVLSTSDATPAAEYPGTDIVVTISSGPYTINGTYELDDGGTSSSTTSGACTAEAGTFTWTCACGGGDGGG